MAKRIPGAKNQKGRRNRKFGRNKPKCEAYRRRVGKPRGPGEPGNKAGVVGQFECREGVSTLGVRPRRRGR